jgi:hypothetical protein
LSVYPFVQAAVRTAGLLGSSLGAFQLKGVEEPIEVYLVK